MAVFRTNTSSPGLYSWRESRFLNRCSNWAFEAKRAFFKTSAAWAISSGSLDNCLIHNANSSLVDMPGSNPVTRKVDSVKSKGSRGSVPCSIKYGENPVTRLTVTLSANTASGTLSGHFLKSPLQDLMMASRSMKCPLSTTPFAWWL